MSVNNTDSSEGTASEDTISDFSESISDYSGSDGLSEDIYTIKEHIHNQSILDTPNPPNHETTKILDTKVINKIKYFEGLDNKSGLSEKIGSKILKDLDELDKLLSEICDKEEKIKPIKNSKQVEYDENQCKCEECGQIFINDYHFNKHTCDKNNKNDDSVDNIPTNIFGQYECMVCKNKYTTPNMLGEHFFLSHNNYQDYAQLDETISDGFPGFELLEYIGMITYSLIDDVPGGIKYLMKKDKRCPICFGIYKYKQSKYRYDKDKYKDIVNYGSDTELVINEPSRYIIGPFFCDEILHEEKKDAIIEIKDKKLLDAINEIRLTERLPIMMNCCECTTCEECLEKYITYSNSIICPFCKKDHTRDEFDYITIIVPSNTTDREKWLPWWEKHVAIFY